MKKNKIYFFLSVFMFFITLGCKNQINNELKYIPKYPYTFKDEIRKTIFLSNEKQSDIEYIISYKSMEDLTNYYIDELKPWLSEWQRNLSKDPQSNAVKIQKLYNTANLFNNWIVIINDLVIIRNTYFIYIGDTLE